MRDFFSDSKKTSDLVRPGVLDIFAIKYSPVETAGLYFIAKISKT